MVNVKDMCEVSLTQGENRQTARPVKDTPLLPALQTLNSTADTLQTARNRQQRGFGIPTLFHVLRMAGISPAASDIDPHIPPLGGGFRPHGQALTILT